MFDLLHDLVFLRSDRGLPTRSPRLAGLAARGDLGGDAHRALLVRLAPSGGRAIKQSRPAGLCHVADHIAERHALSSQETHPRLGIADISADLQQPELTAGVDSFGFDRGEFDRAVCSAGPRGTGRHCDVRHAADTLPYSTKKTSAN